MTEFLRKYERARLELALGEYRPVTGPLADVQMAASLMAGWLNDLLLDIQVGNDVDQALIRVISVTHADLQLAAGRLAAERIRRVHD